MMPPGQEQLARKGANACPERALRVTQDDQPAAAGKPQR
jgi:hypothetical protein